MAEKIEASAVTLNLGTVCDALGTVKYRWFAIGVQVGVPLYKLMEFRKEEDPLVATIDYWLRGNVEGVPVTWKFLVQALKSKHVDELGLAKRIKKFCGLENFADTSSGDQDSVITSSTSTDSSMFKLPLISLKKYFPYFHDEEKKDSISDEDLTLLRYELDQHTSKIKRTFANLVFKLQEHIISCPDSLEKILEVLKLFNKNRFEEVIAHCKTTDEVFEKLYPHFSFFDFELVKLLTKSFGLRSHEKKLKEYKKMFNEYSKQRVCKCPSDAFGDVDESEKVLIFKADKHIKELTVEELLALKYEICQALNSNLRLLRIDNGCVKLTFRAIEVNITEEMSTKLSKLGVFSNSDGTKLIEDASGDSAYSSGKTTTTDTFTADPRDLPTDPAEEFLKSAKPRSNDTSADLHEIILTGKVEDLRMALQQKIYNPIDKDVFNLTALHSAAKHGKLEMLKCLTEEEDFNLSLRDAKGATPLHLASKYGQVEIIEYLISKHVDADAQDDDGYLPVHLACLSNQIAAVKYLVESMYGTNLDAIGFTKTGLALIHVATECGNLDILRYLIEDCNCDPNLRMSKGKSPIFYASEKGHLEIVEYLVESCKCDPIHDEDRAKTTPLHVAAKYGHYTTVQYLVAKGCNVEAKNKFSSTPLLEAAFAGQIDVLKYFVEELNLDPNSEGRKSFNCLHAACYGGHADVVKYLIKNRQMDPYHRVGRSKTTCLHLAAKKGRQLVLEYLSDLEKMKAVMVAGDNDNLTPLHLAAQNNHVMALKCFIENHNIYPGTSLYGVTPLMIAKQNSKQNQKAINYLESRLKGLEPKNVKFYKEMSSIHHLIKHGASFHVVKKEASKYRNCDIPSNFGQTPLHLASSCGRFDIAKFLIEEKKCNPHRQDNAGFTSLHMAAEGGNLELVIYLIKKHHCDPTAESFLVVQSWMAPPFPHIIGKPLPFTLRLNMVTSKSSGICLKN